MLFPPRTVLLWQTAGSRLRCRLQLFMVWFRRGWRTCVRTVLWHLRTKPAWKAQNPPTYVDFISGSCICVKASLGRLVSVLMGRSFGKARLSQDGPHCMFRTTPHMPPRCLRKPQAVNTRKLQTKAMGYLHEHHLAIS